MCPGETNRCSIWIPVAGAENVPRVEQASDKIVLSYGALKSRGTELQMRLTLTLRIEDGLVRFGSEVSNSEPHTVIRELHYPLVGACRLEAVRSSTCWQHTMGSA